MLQVVVALKIEILVGVGWFTINGAFCAAIIIDMNAIQPGKWMLNEEVEMTSQATSFVTTRLWKGIYQFVMNMTESDISLHAANANLSYF